MATHVDVGNTEDSTLVGLPREQMDDVESGQATGGASSVGSDTGLTADSARQVHVTAAGKPRAGRVSGGSRKDTHKRAPRYSEG